jgi:hypothetical protein
VCDNIGSVFWVSVGVEERESSALSVDIGLLSTVMLSVDIAGENAAEGDKSVVEAPSYSVFEYTSDLEDRDGSYINMLLAA